MGSMRIGSCLFVRCKGAMQLCLIGLWVSWMKLLAPTSVSGFCAVSDWTIPWLPNCRVEASLPMCACLLPPNK